MKRWIACMACMALAAALCCACSSRSTGRGTESTDAERAELSMENEKIMERVTEKLGGGVEDLVWAVEAENDNGRLFVKIRVLYGKEADAEAWLEKVCGEGEDATSCSFPLPAFKNSICDDLRSMQPVKEYMKFRQGENGAKTETTEVMTAVNEENVFFIYILGV